MRYCCLMLSVVAGKESSPSRSLRGPSLLTPPKKHYCSSPIHFRRGIERQPAMHIKWLVCNCYAYVSIPEENQACVSKAAAAAVAASSSDQEERSGPNWRPEEEFDSQVTLEAINSRNALSDAGSDGLLFLHLQSIIRTGFGREKFGADDVEEYRFVAVLRCRSIS